MTLEELIDTLESANMLRIFKGDEEIFVAVSYTHLEPTRHRS